MANGKRRLIKSWTKSANCIKKLSMTKLSPKQAATARNNERLVLRHLAALSQKGLSDAMGWSESKVSRMKDGELEDLCAA
ncbi:CII family transcriptional regulator, partial [Kingella kingae]|uniref:CII family transcriptional regulator n=1 Tax=Kingella kingae TaxID=504 RepID=UPI0032B4AA22